MGQSGWTVVRCVDLEANLRWFVDDAGFRVDLVNPADDPRRFVVSRHGVTISLERSDVDAPAHVVIEQQADDLTPGVIGEAPGGSTVTVQPPSDEMIMPDSVPSLTVTGGSSGGFGIGRAGMEYRDLLPDRWGGRFIASHIRIDEGGDVADWVHFHRIRFQMIFVAAGWVDVVYEDQGDPFRMQAGDCVLQPPEIRHRVLRSSPGLEVIEIGCPAEHDTLADHELELPTSIIAPDRDFGGQRFVRHVAADAPVSPWLVGGLRWRDTGIDAATDGEASAIVVSPDGDGQLADAALTNAGEFALMVGVRGTGTLAVDGHGPVEVAERASVALPPGSVWQHTAASPDHELLVVTLPADAIRPA
ncbi:cupin domain-containing protein [Ilumatobacter coccineus]|uniref:Cupin 2 conserved barrel domain-containing protein n=1 Tax=Ilumatobacter coccineus (strain NBRC 103263 / KCTC 29153 / YM16-304) TaxID=1313172 RepID=A0A6C7E9V8_ILUCY|nr:hypothetical protein [Ilumatobacter coccineus]BAN03123.1 hypothetical protein YM304_28090 [Ilumatobacter coccineus YM16-304]